MSSFFSSDGSSTIQFAIIFLAIFVVLAVVVFAFRRLTGRGQALSSKVGGRGRQPRLGIVDIYELDRQRQLILLRRDNVEHLLLVGGPNDVMIERNIARGVGARPAMDEATLAEPDPVHDEPAEREPARFPPAFEMPVVVAAPLPGSTARPDPVGRPLNLADPEPVAVDTVRAPDPRPAFDGLSEDPLSVPPPPPSVVPPSRPARRMPPSLANLVPGLAKPARSAEPAPDIAAPEAPEPVATPPGVPAPPVAPAVDSDILSDMARQLEQVVRRPTPAVSPSPAGPDRPEPDAPVPDLPAPNKPVQDLAPPPPVPAPMPMPAPFTPDATAARPAKSDAVDPMAAAMSATAESSESDDALFDPPARSAAAVDRRIPAVDRPTPTPAAPVPPVPAPAPAKPASPEVKPAVPDAKPAALDTKLVAPEAKSAAANPFSVEEIEAEFARLLGRSLDKKG